jgi:3-phenylpropionate/trans-cinnamate dioxygenase ferredoxin reductase subunit
MSRVLIVGAGHAGGRTAQALRTAGFAGSIRLVGSEPHLPYERPPLSKGVLTGQQAVDGLLLASAAQWAAEGIAVETGRAVRAIHAAERVAETSDGERLPYDFLVVATGGRPRPLPVTGAAECGALYLRGMDDALAIRARLAPGVRLCVVGGGVIGLELAASARQLGAEVSLVESASTLLARVAPPLLGTWMAEQHRSHGVNLLLRNEVVRMRRKGEGIAVETRDGRSLQADLVVAGIGILPNVEPLASCGLDLSNGVLVDEWGRSADARIFAVGDVARTFHPRLGRHLRHESWRNAESQGQAVAAAIMGQPLPEAPLPWMWTDQYDLNVQVAGVAPAESDWVLRGSVSDRKFTLIALQDGRVAAGCTVNQGRDMRFVQQLVGRSLERSALADAAQPLQALARVVH